jgi:hypothetical protein
MEETEFEGAEGEGAVRSGLTMAAESPFAATQLASAPSIGTAVEAISRLQRLAETNRTDLQRISLQREPVEVRDALRLVLNLQPEMLEALGEVTRLPEDQQELITTVLALPLEVQTTLRAILT